MMRENTTALFCCFIFTALVFVLQGCQAPRSEELIHVWSKNQGLSAPQYARAEFPEVETSLRIERALKGSHLSLERPNSEAWVQSAPQKFFEAFVQGGHQTVIKGSERELHFVRTAQIFTQEQLPTHEREKIKTLFENRHHHTQRLIRKLGLKPEMVLQEPQVWIIEDRGPNIVLAVDVYRPYLSRVQRIYFSDQLRVHSFEDMSSHFDAPAWVYSVFSRDEMVQDYLRNLSSSTRLVSSFLQVQSQSPQQVRPNELPQRFSLEDPRFDQVQAFYWAQKALNFAFEHLGLSLNRRVEIETSVGFPDKTNAALTYANQIRLGSGDGVVYRNMARDPSIVIHEMGHIINNTLASLPVTGGGGAINEGLSDYFAATVLNNPLMGADSYIPASYRRDISEERKFSDRTGRLYQDSLIVSNLLWQIRIEIGQEKADLLYIHTIPRLGNAQKLVEFAVALIDAAQTILSFEDHSVVRELLISREWPL